MAQNLRGDFIGNGAGMLNKIQGKLGSAQNRFGEFIGQGKGMLSAMKGLGSENGRISSFVDKFDGKLDYFQKKADRLHGRVDGLMNQGQAKFG